MKRNSIFVIGIGLFSLIPMDNKALCATSVIVGPGETLSEILYRYSLKPIYGKNGNLKKVIKLNPEIKSNSKNGDLVYPGQVIFLPSEAIIPQDHAVKDHVEDNFVDSRPEREGELREMASLGLSPSSKTAGSISFSWSPKYYRVDGKAHDGTKGALGSTLSHGGELSFFNELSPSASLNVHLGLTNVRYEIANDKKLLSNEQTLYFTDIDWSYAFSDSSVVSFGAGVREFAFYRAASSESFKIEKVSAAGLYSKYSKSIFEYKNTQHVVSLFGRYYLPFEQGVYDMEGGYGAGGSYRINHQYRKKIFFLEAVIARDYFPTSEIDYSQTLLGFNIGVNFSSGEIFNRKE
jgi:hypothetical protein